MHLYTFIIYNFELVILCTFAIKSFAPSHVPCPFNLQCCNVTGPYHKLNKYGLPDTSALAGGFVFHSSGSSGKYRWLW